MKRLSNISLREFRDFLTSQGLHLLRTKGGHEAWFKEGLTRPVIIQTHEDPVPEDVVCANLRTLNISKAEFLKSFEQ